MTGAARGEVVWRPDPERAAASPARCVRSSSAHTSPGTRPEPTPAGYAELLDWSARRPGRVLGGVHRLGRVRWFDRPTEVLADASMPGARWFVDATLNHADHLLHPVTGWRTTAGRHRRRDRPRDPRTTDRVELTWAELLDAVASAPV
ncbi:MAG: acetyl-coenzyme A synthetase N-terminal domain-containing protein [Ilumatobacteraceae bacterium]